MAKDLEDIDRSLALEYKVKFMEMLEQLRIIDFDVPPQVAFADQSILVEVRATEQSLAAAIEACVEAIKCMEEKEGDDPLQTPDTDEQDSIGLWTQAFGAVLSRQDACAAALPTREGADDEVTGPWPHVSEQQRASSVAAAFAFSTMCTGYAPPSNATPMMLNDELDVD